MLSACKQARTVFTVGSCGGLLKRSDGCLWTDDGVAAVPLTASYRRLDDSVHVLEGDGAVVGWSSGSCSASAANLIASSKFRGRKGLCMMQVSGSVRQEKFWCVSVPGSR